MYYLMNWPTFGCCLVVKSYCLRTVQRFQRWQLREELACHSGHCHHSSSVNQPVFLLTLRSVPARQTLWSGLLQWPAQAKENSVMKHTYMLCKFCHRHHHSASRLRGHVCRIRMENEQRKLTWKGQSNKYYQPVRWPVLDTGVVARLSAAHLGTSQWKHSRLRLLKRKRKKRTSHSAQCGLYVRLP